MAICPICRSDAEMVESSFVDGKTFRCAKHGEFQVSNSVLKVSTLSRRHRPRERLNREFAGRLPAC